jgi:hypothetical protein
LEPPLEPLLDFNRAQVAQVQSGAAAAVLSNDSDFAVAEDCLLFPLDAFEWGAPSATGPGYARGLCYR